MEQLLLAFFGVGLSGLMLLELVNLVQKVEPEPKKRTHKQWMRNFLRRRSSRQRNTVFKLIDEVMNVRLNTIQIIYLNI